MRALHSTDDAVVQASLDVLLILSRTQETRDLLVAEGAAAQLVQLVLLAEAAAEVNVDLLEASCEALLALCQGRKDVSASVARECGSRDLASVLKGHAGAEHRALRHKMATSLIRLLALSSQHEKNVGVCARLDGTLALLLDVLGAPARAELHAATLELLEVYLRSSSLNVDYALGGGRLAVVYEVVEGGLGVRALMLHGLRVLRSCCAHGDKNVAAIAAEGGVRVAMAALQRHADDLEVAAAVTALVGRMMADAGGLALLHDARAFEKLDCLLPLHPDQRALQKQVCMLMWGLSARPPAGRRPAAARAPSAG